MRALDLAWEPDLPRLWRWKSHSDICVNATVEVRRTINALLSQPWFQRTWVRQEVYASAELALQLGKHQIAFRQLVRKMDHLEKVLTLMDAVDPPLQPPATLPTLTEEYQHLGSDHNEYIVSDKTPSYTAYWLRTLTDGAAFQVTDPKDRVYAALGILMNRSVRLIARAPSNIESLTRTYPVDYKKTISEVYQDALKFNINTTQSLEVLDFFQQAGGCTPLDRGDTMPSWARDWSQEAKHIGFRCRYREYDRRDHVDILTQDYLQGGTIQLKGAQVVKQLVSIDRRKEISHPRDRFTPKYRRSITLSDLLQGPRRRGSGYKPGVSQRMHHPPYAYVLSCFDETHSAYELRNNVVLPADIGDEFAQYLTGESFVFGYADDWDGDASLRLGSMHFILPRDVQLDDVIVSFYGSSCLHLLRPSQNNKNNNTTEAEVPPPSYQYMSPVVAVICEQDQIDEYSRPSRLGFQSFSKDEATKTPPEEDDPRSGGWQTTFTLV